MATSIPNWDYVYHYDAVGNIDQLTDQIGANDRLYTYDALDRLTLDNKTTIGTLGQIQFQYDAGGNRTLWKQGTSTLFSYTHTYASTSNRQSAFGSTAITQDAAGNQIGYGSKTFGYDSANRMTTATVGTTTASYRYNGLGQRTTKLTTTGGVTTTTHYEYSPDGKYLAQIEVKPDGSYAQSDDYIWLDDLPIAQVHTTYGLNNAITSQQLTYIHADHLNTPRAMTDSTKKIVWKWESEAYGKNAPVTDPDGDGIQNKLDLRFPGQIADQETGFYYNMNRYYDPVTGRYTQSDPIGLMGGLNTYGYVSGNPINNADPSGLFAAIVVRSAIQVGSRMFTAIGTGLAVGTGAGTPSAEQNSSSKDDAPSEPEKNCPNCTLRFLREVYYSGNTKTCVYKQDGSFGMFTFPQWKDKPCYPVNLKTCMVDTSTMDPMLYGK